MFNKSEWSISDIDELNKHLESISNKDKIEFTKRVVNTNMEVLGITIPTLRNISKEIYKGNYYKYLDMNNNKYYENTIINACIISKIKDFNTLKKYLDNYVKQIDNWSSCDTLSFNINNNENNYFNLAKEYLNSNKPFIRRVGLIILFSFKKNKDYLNKIFSLIDNLSNEEEYYVNMASAWLLCELLIYNRDEVFNYLKVSKTNNFIINKTISKCRDSFRVSKSDKELLINLRREDE